MRGSGILGLSDTTQVFFRTAIVDGDFDYDFIVM